MALKVTNQLGLLESYILCFANLVLVLLLKKKKKSKPQRFHRGRQAVYVCLCVYVYMYVYSYVYVCVYMCKHGLNATVQDPLPSIGAPCSTEM